MYRFIFMLATSAALFAIFFVSSGGFNFEPMGGQVAEAAPVKPDAKGKEMAVQAATVSKAAVTRTTATKTSDTQKTDPAMVQMASASSTDTAPKVDASVSGLTLTRAKAPRNPGTTSNASSANVETRAIAAAMKPADSQDDADIRQVAGTVVNMRSGPGTGYQVIDQLTEGTRVRVTDQKGSWLQLQSVDGGQSGWMFSNLVTASAD